MQVIRLNRVGRHKYPLYRIVTAEKRRAANGKFITILGHYNPHTKELVIKKEQLQTAIEHGAQPSNVILKLMQKDGIALPKWATITTRQRSAKKPEAKSTEVSGPAETAPAATTAAETKTTPKEASETPAEVKKAEAAVKTEAKVADAVIAEAAKEKKAT